MGWTEGGTGSNDCGFPARRERTAPIDFGPGCGLELCRGVVERAIGLGTQRRDAGEHDHQDQPDQYRILGRRRGLFIDQEPFESCHDL